MKTKAVRLHGKGDLKLDEFDLPPLRDDEILAHIICNSICMSSYKAAIKGEEHKRVPSDLKNNPIIIGHEFCGEIIEVGRKWRHKFEQGERFVLQPALNYRETSRTPGYSFRYLGGNATYVIIPEIVIETDCLLKYNGEAYFAGSLAEPMSCIIGAFREMYHTNPGRHEHIIGIEEGGNMAILGGAGPMGLGAIDYAVHNPRKPELLVVTDIDSVRINRARQVYPEKEAEINGVRLEYVNTEGMELPEKYLLRLSGNKGYNDVMVFAPIQELVELGDKVLTKDGCLNFFAGPTEMNFSAMINFYNLHYESTHFVGTSGGNTEDMREAIILMQEEKINPAAMITHIGGLNTVADTILSLPSIPGGKKLIYTSIELELTSIDEFKLKGKKDPFFADLHEITAKNKNIWCLEAEQYLLKYAKKI
ncbi:MAG: L-sorbose 1-phosphate reductase [Spirochaetes bacterium]|nr:MAG: L-sorbose 1-phosphate reductase [Spirochaetota bacterium]